MSRISRMVRLSPGKAVSALAVLVVACIVAIGSGAALTSGTASPGNFVTSGSLTMTSPENGLAQFQVSNIQQGYSDQGRMLFKNTGSVAGDFKINPSENVADSIIANRYSAAELANNPGNPQPLPFGAFSEDAEVKYLSNGLRWRVTKLVPEPGTAACPTMVENNEACYKVDQTPGGVVYDGKLRDGNSVMAIANVPANAWQGLHFSLNWPDGTAAYPDGDADAIKRTGVRSEWAIHVTATS